VTDRIGYQLNCVQIMAGSRSDPSSGPKALVFDLMGTCCDWYSSILPALQAAPSIPALPPDALAKLAADWREGFFKEANMRYEARQPVEDIDVTHRRVLNWLLLARGVSPRDWDGGVRSKLVQAWHVQTPWPDVMDALERLKQKYIMSDLLTKLTMLLLISFVTCSVVLANGSTRLQIDIAKSAGLPFHMLLSSELLRQTKVCVIHSLSNRCLDKQALTPSASLIPRCTRKLWSYSKSLRPKR